MPIAVVCPKCNAKLNAPDTAAGKKVKCPKCQAPMVVPAPVPPEPEFEVMDEPEPLKPAPKPTVKAKPKSDVTVEDDEDEKPRKKKARAEVDDDEEDERPRKKKQKRADEDEGNSSMTRNILGAVVLLVLLGVAGWVFYDKFGKKDGDTAGNNSGGNPPVNIPPPPTGPQITPPKGPGGNPAMTPSTLAGKGYKITFPDSYHLDERASKHQTAQFDSPAMVYTANDPIARAQFGILAVELRNKIPEKLRKVMNDEMLERFAKGHADYKIISRREVVVGGQGGIEGVIKGRLFKDEPAIIVATVRFLVTEDRIFFVSVLHEEAHPLPPEALQKFFDSFELSQ